MAKNRSEPKKSVQEEDSSTDNGGSESESEPEQPITQTHIAKKASSSSSETDSESGSDSESRRPDPISKHTDLPTSPRKSGADAKRREPAAGSEAAEPKRQKRKPESAVESSEIKPSADDSKKQQLFQRVWTEDDEIALLQGMIEYTEKENADPLTDLDAFHDIIRKSVHFALSKKQLQSKMKRMKNKYANKAGKKGEKSFSKPHDQKSYELSKKLWGSDEKSEDDKSEVRVVHALMACNGEGKTKSSINKKAPMVQDDAGKKNNGLGCSSIFNSLSGFIEKNKDVVTSGEKRNVIEKKRKAVVIAEIDLFLKELELIQEQVKATLDAMK